MTLQKKRPALDSPLAASISKSYEQYIDKQGGAVNSDMTDDEIEAAAIDAAMVWGYPYVSFQFGIASISSASRWPARKRKLAAAAIMAALSVHSASGGARTGTG